MLQIKWNNDFMRTPKKSEIEKSAIKVDFEWKYMLKYYLLCRLANFNINY